MFISLRYRTIPITGGRREQVSEDGAARQTVKTGHQGRGSEVGRGIDDGHLIPAPL
jgi:hypothetical protein